MKKITFMGAGSTVFAKNVLGDTMLTPALRECTIALYDIDGKLLDTVKNTQIPLNGVASVKLAGKGETIFTITGYHIYDYGYH